MYSVTWPGFNPKDVELSEPELTGFALVGYYNYGPAFRISRKDGKDLNLPPLFSGNVVLAPNGGPFVVTFNPDISWRMNMVGIFGGSTDEIVPRMDTYAYNLWLTLLTGASVLVIYNHEEITAGIGKWFALAGLEGGKYIQVVRDVAGGQYYTID